MLLVIKRNHFITFIFDKISKFNCKLLLKFTSCSKNRNFLVSCFIHCRQCQKDFRYVLAVFLIKVTVDKFPLYKQNTWMKIKRRWCRNHESIVSSPVEISDTFPSKFCFIWLQKFRFLFIWRKFFQVVFWRISFAITGS